MCHVVGVFFWEKLKLKLRKEVKVFRCTGATVVDWH